MARKSRKLSRRNLLVATAALLAIMLLLYFAFFNSTSKSGTIPSTNPTLPTNSQSNSPTSGSNSTNSSSTSSSPSTKDQSNVPASSFSGTLLTPYGDFVSNHNPGGSAPTSEASVCNTSVGATCYIEFTKDGVIKKLTTQTTDANGATYWYWDVKTAGLDSGSWTITAVASGGSQTKTANDPRALVVQ